MVNLGLLYCNNFFFFIFFSQENGGCGFFEWCDGGSAWNSSNSMFPDLPCPCGDGSCLVLTAKTGKNIGRQFYRCPANQVVLSCVLQIPFLLFHYSFIFSSIEFGITVLVSHNAVSRSIATMHNSNTQLFIIVAHPSLSQFKITLSFGFFMYTIPKHLVSVIL